MAEKKLYNVILKEGCDQDHFLHHGDGCNCECVNHLAHIDRIVVMSLTDEEAQTLAQSADVESIEQELPVNEDYVPFKSDTNQGLITRVYPSATANGADYCSTYFHYTSNTSTAVNPGYFTADGEFNLSANQTISQTFAGEFVDLVAIEAGTPVSSYDSWIDHPDFLDSEGNRKFVPMNWSTHGASDANNQQVAGTYFSAHAIGVLSIMGGSVCSWAKVSSLRVIYLSAGVTTAYNAVVDWHNNKPVNPLTGKRNATVTSGSWGFTHTTLNNAVKVSEIASINAYDDQGNLTVINRPGGGWGTDFTPFYDNLLVPRVITDPDTSTPEWMIPWGQLTPLSSWATLMNSFGAVEGLYHFKSYGNDGNVSVGPTDPRSNTSITTDATFTRYSLGSGDTFSIRSFPGTTGTTVTPLVHYTNGANGDKIFYVTASQHSVFNPLLDDYSGRGPGATISGFGSETYTCYPGAFTAADGQWNNFGGTSCAAPSVGGIAAVIVGWWLAKYGSYPTQQELMTFILDNATDSVVGEATVDFSNVPTASNSFSNSRLYATTDVYRIQNGNFWNGSTDLTELAGNTTKRVFLPDSVRLDYGYNIPQVRSKTLGTRPVSGQCYPRRKIRIQ